MLLYIVSGYYCTREPGARTVRYESSRDGNVLGVISPDLIPHPRLFTNNACIGFAMYLLTI